MTSSTLKARRDRVLGAGAPLFYREPLHVVRGDGVYLYDPDGRRYVDMYNNVPCVGHGNARVVEAMASQQATLNVHSRYLNEGIVELAERLVSLHGENLENVVFSCSGTEANEVALRIARVATGRRGIIASDAAYHGTGASEVGKLTYLRLREGSRSGDVHGFPFPETYRPIEEGLGEAALADAYLERLQALIDGLEEDGAGVAAFLICPIFANEGLPNVPRGFLPQAAERVRAAGGLVIADEVQAGYCRTGRWWGYQVGEFEPDIVTSAKPMGNGLPLAATVASGDLVRAFQERTFYFNTAAATPLQAAVGLAVLDEIEERRLDENAAVVGAYLKSALRDAQTRCEPMGDVRGHGLFLGVDWVTDRESRKPDTEGAVDVVNRLKDKGFLTSNAGVYNNVVKIRPPLIFSKEHASAFIEAFEETIGELHG
jgi:4-aminobutyrate aminotransferase-like enzyme